MEVGVDFNSRVVRRPRGLVSPPPFPSNTSLEGQAESRRPVMIDHSLIYF